MCAHPRTGMVSCSPGEDNYAQDPVCGDPRCIDEASAWVKRLTGKVPVYVLKEVNREGNT